MNKIAVLFIVVGLVFIGLILLIVYSFHIVEQYQNEKGVIIITSSEKDDSSNMTHNTVKPNSNDCIDNFKLKDYQVYSDFVKNDNNFDNAIIIDFIPKRDCILNNKNMASCDYNMFLYDDNGIQNGYVTYDITETISNAKTQMLWETC